MTKDEEIARLRKQLKAAQQHIPYPCPVCGEGQVFCSTVDGGILVHNCGPKHTYTVRPKTLKEGQKSLLTNAVGGIE